MEAGWQVFAVGGLGSLLLLAVGASACWLFHRLILSERPPTTRTIPTGPATTTRRSRYGSIAGLGTDCLAVAGREPGKVKS